MSRAEVWLVITAMALVTFALRASFLLLPERLGTPKSFERALRYVPTAVIAAIVTPAVLQLGSAEGLFDQLVPRLVAAVAGLIAWCTREHPLHHRGGDADPVGGALAPRLRRLETLTGPLLHFA